MGGWVKRREEKEEVDTEKSWAYGSPRATLPAVSVQYKIYSKEDSSKAQFFEEMRG